MYASRFLSVLSLALVVASLFAEANSQEWCKRTTNTRLCQSRVQADPRTKLKTSLEGIGTILKDKAVLTAVSTSHKILRLIRTTRNKKVVDILNACAQAYSRAIPSLKSADFNHFDYTTLVRDFTDGGDAAHECKTLLQEPGLGPSPLQVENDSLIGIYHTALEIINLRKCNRPSFSCP